MKIIKGKFLKVFLVLSLLVPFFMFNPIYASQQTSITFDDDSLTGIVADVFEIGTYTLSDNKPTITPNSDFSSVGERELSNDDKVKTDNFVNACVKVIKNSEVNPVKSISINTAFDVVVGKVYIALVRKADAAIKSNIYESSSGKYITKVDNNRYNYEFIPMLYLAAVDPVSITCKATMTEKVGNIYIVKELTSYRASKPVTFVFKISKIEGTATKELDVVAITFDGPGHRSLLVENIPIGVDIKVEEIYSGAGYTISDETKIAQTNKIETEGATISFSFENKFDEDKKKGYGISNTFERVSTGWDYVKDVSAATGGTNE